MNSKTFRLLIFPVILFGFIGFADTASAVVIDEIRIEAHDADNQPANPYGIRLARITVEGELDDSDDYVLGSVLIILNDNGNGVFNPGENTIKITQGFLINGDHELAVAAGTHIVSDDMIETNSYGEFTFAFYLPADAVANADRTIALTFGNEEGDLDAQIYDPILFIVPVGERSFNFAAQVPQLTRGRVDDGIYRNGDQVTVRLEYETPAGGPPLSRFEEIELLTILPDFSNVDSAFALGNSTFNVPPFGLDNDTTSNSVTREYGRYDLDEWDPGNKNFNSLDLYDLALDVDRAVRDGRLIIDPNGGDYDVTYIISSDNRNNPGRKRLFVHAIDFPSVLDIEDAETIFDRAGLDFPDDLNLGTWQTSDPFVDDGDNDNNDVNLDNKAPNFDFAFINPFVEPPLRKWVDFDQDGHQDADEWAYVYKEGDVIRVMVQIDPHDLTEQELNEVKEDDLHDTGNEDGTVRNIMIIGDISDLLNPEHPDVDLTSDGNGNGIPDDAEVRFVVYAGGNGRDDDFDGEDGEYDDDEDTTVNGINERFLYLLDIEVDERFKGVSGDRPYTTDGLAIRLMIQDSIGNRAYLSTWRETLFDPEIWRWIPVDYAEWNGNVRDIGLVDGIRNPMYFDPPAGDEVFVPDGVITIGGITYYSSMSFQPTPGHVRTPLWSPGYQILANWDKPFRVIIDGAPPSVSIIRDIKQSVGVDDQAVTNGAAVVPIPGPHNVNHVPPTVLVDGRGGFIGPGNFIYEITGNGDELVTLESYYPSDNDVYFVKFEYSEDDVNFKPMKGVFNDYEKSGQFVDGRLPRESLLLYDIAGNITDDGYPGARYGVWHDAINGDDDGDNDPDLFDDEVDDAHRLPLSDNRDNDADGLVDMADRDEDNFNTEVYDRDRDEDEDGFMDEDEYVVPARFDPGSNSWVANWTFDPLRIARVLDLSPNRAYAIRAVPYDLAGNVIQYGIASTYVVFRVVGPGFEVEGDATVQIYKNGQLITGQSIQENRVYDLVAVPEGIVNVVAFQYSVDRKTWVLMPTASGESNPDTIPPFRISWRPMLDQLAADLWWDWDKDGVKDPGEPPFQSGDVLYIRALALPFGQLGKYQVVNGLEIDPQTFIPYAPLVAPPAITPPSAPSLATMMSDTPTLILNLKEGWNLVSICVDNTGNNDLASILSQLGGAWNSVWSYEAGIGWKWRVNGIDDYTLYTMEPKKGYWINMNSDAELFFQGAEIDDTTVPLYTGPNLVGYSSFGRWHPADALASIADDYTSVWTYKGGSWLKYAKNIPGFPSDLSEMEPGSGYFIYVEGDCYWVIPE